MWKEVWEGNCDYLHILVRTESEVGAVPNTVQLVYNVIKETENFVLL